MKRGSPNQISNKGEAKNVTANHRYVINSLRQPARVQWVGDYLPVGLQGCLRGVRPPVRLRSRLIVAVKPDNGPHLRVAGQDASEERLLDLSGLVAARLR